jgi:effector-binding domain-containing protein
MVMMAGEQHGKEVEILQLEAQSVLSIRTTVQIAKLGEAMGGLIPALLGYMQQSGARPCGPVFVRYHTFGETATDLELGIPVVERVAGEGRIVAGELAGGPAVSTWHMGPHDKLGEAYARINTFISEQGHEPDGPAREVYYWIDPSRNSDVSIETDPTNWGQQLIQPVK